jgi:hypothetical protein
LSSAHKLIILAQKYLKRFTLDVDCSDKEKIKYTKKVQTSTHLAAAVVIGVLASSNGSRQRDIRLALAAMEAPDIIEYSIYLGFRRRALLAEALESAISERNVVSGYHNLKAHWFEREFTGFWLHNIKTLSLVVPVLGLAAYKGKRDMKIAYAAILLHAAMDIQGDLQAVGDIRNWTGDIPEHVHTFLADYLPKALLAGSAVNLLAARR